MTKVRLCSEAENEFTNALCWYADRSSEVASVFDSEFDRTLEKITARPDSFPVCDERHRFVLMRRFPYQIIYRAIGDTVMIVAVAHTSREPGYWSNR